MKSGLRSSSLGILRIFNEKRIQLKKRFIPWGSLYLGNLNHISLNPP